MIGLAIILALIGALANTVATILQKRSAGAPNSSELFGRNFLGSMLVSRLWLSGIGFDLVGSIFQAGALYFGTLVLVEPLLTFDLVILFLILHFRYKSKTTRAGWLGTGLVTVGLAVFLGVINPREVDAATNFNHLFVAIALMVVFIIIAGFVMRLTVVPARPRLVLGASATGLNFAITSVFTKLAMTDLSHGIMAMLTGWAVYALIVSAGVAVVVMQATYASGSLRLSQPIITIVGPVASVMFGVFVLGTSVRTSLLAVVFEAVGVAAIVLGIILLTNSRTVSKFEDSGQL